MSGNRRVTFGKGETEYVRLTLEYTRMLTLGWRRYQAALPE